MCIELKIKSKHLALEPSIIRKEEDKLKKQMRYHRSDDSTSTHTLETQLNSLVNHRKVNVRNEARATFLARAYIAGKPYSYAEKTRSDDVVFKVYILPRILVMVQRYHDRRATIEVIQQWSMV